jgi:putative phage-type endonuclease
MVFHLVDLEQGSTAWLRWRHDGIGGSDAPALMGENPWRSAKALLAEKAAPSRHGNAPPPALRPLPARPVVADLFATAPPAAKPPPPDRRYRSAASRGTALEPYARDLYNAHVGGALHPQCLQAIDRPWQRASLDGFCAATRRALEIKCGDKVYDHVETTGKVPRYYVGQLQHILAVSGFDAIDFWVWLPGKTPLLLTVPRDDDYIAELNARGASFWNEVMARRSGPGIATRP